MTNRLFATLGLAAALLLLAAGCDLLGGEEESGKPELTGKIVFAASRLNEEGKRTDDGNIYTMNADGSNLQRLTNFGSSGGAINPAWSPDGQTIAFASGYEATTLGPYLYLMDADGSNQRFFKRYRTGVPRAVVGWDPVWSPNGKQLAYSRCMNCEAGGQNYEVFVTKVAGREYEPEDEIRLTDHPASNGGPAWSPSGKEVAFTSNRPYFRSDSARFLSDLYIKNADGMGRIRRLTKTGYIGASLWHPDSDQIVCGLNGKRNKGNLLFVDLTTGSTSRISIDLQAPLSIYPIRWSPNGNQVLLGATSSQEYNLYVLEVKSRQYKRIQLPSYLEISGRPDWFVKAKK